MELVDTAKPYFWLKGHFYIYLSSHSHRFALQDISDSIGLQYCRLKIIYHKIYIKMKHLFYKMISSIIVWVNISCRFPPVQNPPGRLDDPQVGWCCF